MCGSQHPPAHKSREGECGKQTERSVWQAFARPMPLSLHGSPPPPPFTKEPDMKPEAGIDPLNWTVGFSLGSGPSSYVCMFVVGPLYLIFWP